MEDLSQTLALTLGAGWASGINLYAAILVLGFLGLTGRMDLPEGLQILSDPLVMMVAGFMYLVEFFADKTPGVDTVWDSFHTLIRIPAGALLAAGAVGDIGPGPNWRRPRRAAAWRRPPRGPRPGPGSSSIPPRSPSPTGAPPSPRTWRWSLASWPPSTTPWSFSPCWRPSSCC